MISATRRRSTSASSSSSPKDPEGYVGLGASYDRLGRFDLSDRVYASLYALSGGTAQYYNNVGYSYMLRGNLTAALTNFRKAKASSTRTTSWSPTICRSCHGRCRRG